MQSTWGRLWQSEGGPASWIYQQPHVLFQLAAAIIQQRVFGRLRSCPGAAFPRLPGNMHCRLAATTAQSQAVHTSWQSAATLWHVSSRSLTPSPAGPPSA